MRHFLGWSGVSVTAALFLWVGRTLQKSATVADPQFSSLFIRSTFW